MQKNVDISKIKRALLVQGIFSETTYLCVLTCQKFLFIHKTFFVQVLFFNHIPYLVKMATESTKILRGFASVLFCDFFELVFFVTF